MHCKTCANQDRGLPPDDWRSRFSSYLTENRVLSFNKRQSVNAMRGKHSTVNRQYHTKRGKLQTATLQQMVHINTTWLQTVNAPRHQHSKELFKSVVFRCLIKWLYQSLMNDWIENMEHLWRNNSDGGKRNYL
jgi:hypothetical protein